MCKRLNYVCHQEQCVWYLEIKKYHVLSFLHHLYIIIWENAISWKNLGLCQFVKFNISIWSNWVKLSLLMCVTVCKKMNYVCHLMTMYLVLRNLKYHVLFCVCGTKPNQWNPPLKAHGMQRIVWDICCGRENQTYASMRHEIHIVRWNRCCGTENYTHDLKTRWNKP